ncbi:MAG: DUF1405 domain-containing protein [Thermoplasmata archaeon]
MEKPSLIKSHVKLERRSLDIFHENILLLVPIILINIGGTFFGYYYYAYQLQTSPIYLWPFIPDCPLFTTLLLISLALHKKWRSSEFNFLIFIGLIKYGIWTLFALTLYYEASFLSQPEFTWALFALHAAMALEAILLYNRIEPVKNSHAFLILAFMLASDFSDYFLGTHPWTPGGKDHILAIFTFSLTVIVWSVSFLFFNSNSNKDYHQKNKQ